jgi:hypothetical protein
MVAVEAAEPVLEEDGTFTLVTPVEDAERHLERGLERMRKENPGKAVSLITSEVVTNQVTFEHGWGITPRCCLGSWQRSASGSATSPWTASKTRARRRCFAGYYEAVSMPTYSRQASHLASCRRNSSPARLSVIGATSP